MKFREYGAEYPRAESRPAMVPVEARSLATFTDAFRNSAGILDATYFDAWSIPAAWRASTLLGGLVGSLPLNGWRDRADGSCAPITPTPVLLSSPVPGRSNIEVFSSWVHDYLFHGNAIAIIATRDAATGWPTALIPIPAAWVGVTPIDRAANMDLATLGGNVLYRIQGQVYAPRDILHVRGPAQPGALRGVGVLEAAFGAFCTAKDQQAQTASIAKHGVPTGLLKASDPDVTPEELASGKASWLSAQGNASTIAALPPGVEFQAISWNPTDMQMLEARKYSDSQMALLFGLPASFLNVEGSSSTYSNMQQDDLSLLKFTLNLILQRFEQEWSRHLPRGQRAKFDRAGLLEADALTRYQTYQIGISAGFLTDDEARAAEGKDPLPQVTAADPEVQQAMQLAASAPSLVQNPGLPALVDQLRVLNGKKPKNPAPAPAAPAFPPADNESGDES